MLYVDGMGGNFYRGFQFLLGGHANRNGIDFFSINHRGHDTVSRTKRLKNGKLKGVTIGTQFEKFEDCIYDIAGAIKLLKKKGYKEIILAGHSTGCQKIAYYQYKTKDSSVRALVLLAPADDYNVDRKELGKNLKRIFALSNKLVKQKKGDTMIENALGFSAQRLQSVINLDRVEARLFNYNGGLKEFSSIKVPILAIFGSKEEYKTKPVERCLKILEEKTNSKSFSRLIIPGATHSFVKKEDEFAIPMMKWLKKILPA
jgi:pimeloyl-ACP methyl ester carboxylesterase